MATFTRDWNESAPAGTDQASSGDDEIKHLKVEISDRLKALIYGFVAGENDGKPGCKNLIFKQQTAAPSTPNADEISVYALDDGTNCGLYAKQEDGYTKQLLKKVGSDINFAIEAADIPADTIDSQHYAAASIDNEHLADGAVDTEELAADAVDGTRIADDSVDSEHLAGGSIDPEHIGTLLSAYTRQDADAANMVKGTTYTAATDGMVTAYITLAAGKYLSVTVAGDVIESIINASTSSVSALVGSGETFVVNTDQAGEPVIRWKSFGTLSKPTK